VTRLRLERTDAIGRIVLARPEKKNALDLAAALELQDAFRSFASDESIRVVILSADGDDFCAGADLGALHSMLDADIATHQRDAEALGDVFRAIRDLPQVVIAAVSGRALAGGAGLATACDIVVAHEGARFGYPEVRVGFVPAMVMTLLRRQIGEKRAFELVATGRQVSAREALELGVTGVPFFVIDGKFGIPGAQDAPSILSVLERAWTKAHPLEVAVPASGSACEGDSCAV